MVRNHPVSWAVFANGGFYAGYVRRKLQTTNFLGCAIWINNAEMANNVAKIVGGIAFKVPENDNEALFAEAIDFLGLAC